MKYAPVLGALTSSATLALVAAGIVAFRASEESPVPDLVPVLLAPDRTPLWVQRFEVTVAEWNACHDAGGCSRPLMAPAGMPPEVTPATTLNHIDASQYVAWISSTTHRIFRLPTAAEWSALASEVLPDAPAPIFTDPALSWASDYLLEETAPRDLRISGSFSATSDGIADLDGSVWEWTQDCAVPELAQRCPAYVAGGLHMAVVSFLDRDPARGGCAVGKPPAHLGLRLVSDEPLVE